MKRDHGRHLEAIRAVLAYATPVILGGFVPLDRVEFPRFEIEENFVEVTDDELAGARARHEKRD